MYGLKNNKKRWNDGLSRLGWDRFERLLANYYRNHGYRVEHIGTGSSSSKYDGGIDLKLYKDDEYIIVQCKHWNAKQVPHNEVHQLLGIVVSEGATGGKLISSGEFTSAAIHSAARNPIIELVDGDFLREMLDMPGQQHILNSDLDSESISISNNNSWYEEVFDMLLNSGSRRRKIVKRSFAAIFVVKIVLPALIFIFGYWFITSQINDLSSRLQSNAARQVTPVQSAPSSQVQQKQSRIHVDSKNQPYAEIHSTQNGMTPAAIKEWERRNKESMEILEKTTPEL
jgi:restriction system protein